jgi:hypothetical protein
MVGREVDGLAYGALRDAASLDSITLLTGESCGALVVVELRSGCLGRH